MTTPSFVAAGAGATTTGGTLNVPAISGLSGGETIFVLLSANSWSNPAELFTMPAGWVQVADAFGPGGSNLGAVLFKRTAPASAGSDGAVAVTCAMSGPKAGIAFACSSVYVPVFSTHTPGNGDTINAASTSHGGPNALGLSVTALAESTTAASFTGESGGDWTEAFAGYAVPTTGPTLQVQTCEFDAGSTGISGGSFTAGTAGYWVTLCLSLIGTGDGVGAVVSGTALSALGTISAFEAAQIAGRGGHRVDDTVDLELIGDMQPHAPTVGAARALILRCRRLLITRRGTWPWAPELGVDLRDYMLSKLPPWRIAADIRQTLLKDEQVIDCSATVEQLEQGRSLRATIFIRSDFAQDFRFTMNITEAAATLTALQQVA